MEGCLEGDAAKLANDIRRFVFTEKSAREIANGKPRNSDARAFRCLLLNRISRGGVTAPGAGWLKSGEDGRGIHSRWYPETLAARIESIHALREKLTFIEGDGLKAIEEFSSMPRTVAFVDPPYVAKGRGAGLRL